MSLKLGDEVLREREFSRYFSIYQRIHACGLFAYFLVVLKKSRKFKKSHFVTSSTL